jgi:hypothetical protein
MTKPNYAVITRPGFGFGSWLQVHSTHERLEYAKRRAGRREGHVVLDLARYDGVRPGDTIYAKDILPDEVLS